MVSFECYRWYHLSDIISSPSRGQKPQGREDVAGSAIAPPGVWSASGACARKGLAESAYAIKLRLFDATELRVLVGWRIVEFADSLQIFGFFLGGFNKKAYFCGKV